MMIVLFCLLFLVIILYLRECVKNIEVNKEILYVKERIAEIANTEESGYILIPSENRKVKELAAQINCLLDIFYAQRAGYKRSKQAMAQMLTNIFHDLRTPLTVLKGYIEWLNKETKEIPDTDNMKNMIARIDSKSDELVQTINEYFTMSKITSGDMIMKLQKENITEICQEVLLDYYDILEKSCFDVDIDVGLSEYAYADTDALKRILKNLVDNVIKYGSDGKYIALRIRKNIDKVIIEVEDHGQGISEKEQEQIFYRNYTTAHKSAGSGLGLTIAKKLALQMGTDIMIASEQGKRTIFSLALKS